MYSKKLSQKIFSILICLALLSPSFALNSCINHPTPAISIPLDGIDSHKTRIVIEKSAYRLKLYEGDRLLRNYPIVLGFDAVNDKKQEGDGCTPEGKFKVRTKYDHKRYLKFIWVDYPNAESEAKFKQNKASGKIPATATIGGEIGIHGTPPDCDQWVAEKRNWTAGCISLTRPDVAELYPLVEDGTEILILH